SATTLLAEVPSNYSSDVRKSFGTTPLEKAMDENRMPVLRSKTSLNNRKKAVEEMKNLLRAALDALNIKEVPVRKDDERSFICSDAVGRAYKDFKFLKDRDNSQIFPIHFLKSDKARPVLQVDYNSSTKEDEIKLFSKAAELLHEQLSKEAQLKEEDVAKKVVHMVATSHEYKKPNVKAGLSFTKNYKWEVGTEKVSNLQGINKPVDEDKLRDMVKKLDIKTMKPLVAVNKLHGIRPQSFGKRILIDGHHRLEACRRLGIEEVPVYKGTYTGKAEPPTKVLEKSAAEKLGLREWKGVFDTSSLASVIGLEKQAQLKEDMKLYPHQERAVKRILSKPNTILAHSVGSGKTLTSIAGFEELKRKGKAKKALVVVPASLRDNYGVDGVGKFTDSTYNIIGNKQEVSGKKPSYGNPSPDFDYNIVSYELFRSNPDKYIKDTDADTVIFDELHRGKNITKTYASIRDSRHLYKTFIGGTGSVVSNKLTDVVPLIDAATGGKKELTTRNNLKKFEQRYFVRDDSPKYKYLTVERRPIKALKDTTSLQHFLNEYVDYVDYDDVKIVAKKIHEKKIKISKEQASAYKKLVGKDRELARIIKQKRYEYLKDNERSRVYNRMIEARKLMNDVGTVRPGEPISETVEQSPKTKALLDDTLEYLANTPDGRVLLTSFLIKGGTESLEAGLKNRDIPYGMFLGKGNPGVTEEGRQEAVRKFNEGKIKALILSGAGGEGLSLNDTTRIGTLDPHYNPERMAQMEARGIRSGGLSKRPPEERYVDVNRYIATMPEKKFLFLKWKDSMPTPDEVIYNIANRKERQNSLLHNVLKDMMKKKDKG
ncbi:MAG: SNF2-related protein, partial [Candidatus Dojkabacteria bacterium]